MRLTLTQIGELVGAAVPAESGRVEITRVASAAEATPGSLTFLGNLKYAAAVATTRASAVLVPLDFTGEVAGSAIALRVEKPSLAFGIIVEKFAPKPVEFAPGIHPTAVVHETAVIADGASIQSHVFVGAGATIGKGSVIGAGGFVGEHAVIGEDCHLHPRVTVREYCVLGNRVIIHSGAVIGSDGFGYEFTGGRHVKIAQVGIVQIDDDVELGANTTIDRARFGRTWIQEGCKIDNLVQIAHNVVIGKHTIIVAQAGIAGSTRVGNYVVIAGQVGIVGHLDIGDQVVIAAQSGVESDIPSGQKWWGSPATEMGKMKRQVILQRKLPDLVKKVGDLEQKLPKST